MQRITCAVLFASLAACTIRPVQDGANETLPSTIDEEAAPMVVEEVNNTPLVAGYASATSVAQGGHLTFYVSSGVPTYDLLIFREGANGRELVHSAPNLPGRQFACANPTGVKVTNANASVGCMWPASYVLNVPREWPSGLYVADLLDDDDSPGKYGSYIHFVVTEDQPGMEANIVVMLPTNTWQAYNTYGRFSLYQHPTLSELGVKLTLDRPHRICGDTDCPSRWESPLVIWLAKEGYRADYIANEDLHNQPDLLSHYDLFISAGHDEYWTKEMRDHLDAYLNAGGNLAVLGGNTMFRQVRYENNGRTLVGYKHQKQYDPLYGVDNIRVTTDFRAAPVNWPQNSSIGLGWTGWVNNNGGAASQTTELGRYTVYRTSHWLFKDTGLTDGNTLWYEPNAKVEVDGAEFVWQNNLPVVTGRERTPLNFVILGLEPSVGGSLTDGYAMMGMYQHASGGTVFHAGSFGWPRGLLPQYNPQHYGIVGQITHNLLRTLSAQALPNLPTSTPTLTPIPTSTLTPMNTPAPTLTSIVPSTLTPTPTPTLLPTPTATPLLTSTPTPTQPANDLIFSDGFETGNLSTWTAKNADYGDLSAKSSAALVGSYGMHALIDDNTPIYVVDHSPNDEMRYRMRFYFDPNSITMQSGENHYIFYGFNETSLPVLDCTLRFYNGAYQIRASVRDDASTWYGTNWFTISDAQHIIEFDWQASTAAGANNGRITFWIDGVQRGNIAGIDNDTRRITRVALGPTGGIDNGTRGATYFDAFESRQSSIIGPATGSMNLASSEDAWEASLVDSVLSVASLVPNATSTLAATLDGVQVEIIIPAQAIAMPATAILTHVEDFGRPDGYTMVGSSFALHLGDVDSEFASVMVQPATIILNYGSLLDSLDPTAGISLLVWNSELQVWEQAYATLRPSEPVLSAQINPLKIYALWQSEASFGNITRLPAIHR
jgi:hypothetical protein